MSAKCIWDVILDGPRLSYRFRESITRSFKQWLLNQSLMDEKSRHQLFAGHRYGAVRNIGREGSFRFCNRLRRSAPGGFLRGQARDGDNSRFLLFCPPLALGRRDSFAGLGRKLASPRFFWLQGLPGIRAGSAGLTRGLLCCGLFNQGSGKTKTCNFGIESRNDLFSIHAL